MQITYFGGHVTTPLVEAKVYDTAIEQYLSKIIKGYRIQLVSVKETKELPFKSRG